jgi:hypothetical protein
MIKILIWYIFFKFFLISRMTRFFSRTFYEKNKTKLKLTQIRCNSVATRLTLKKKKNISFPLVR